MQNQILELLKEDLVNAKKALAKTNKMGLPTLTAVRQKQVESLEKEIAELESK